MRIYEFIIIFFAYGFIGWCWESFLCSSVELDGVCNRGFLLGPYCPIYGIGATLSYLSLKDIDSNLYVFILSAILSCIIEYIIGYTLEKFFHQRWWDYENYPFQIHRRVCLYGLIIFGVANILIVKHLTPMMLLFLGIAENEVIYKLAIILLSVFSLDLILTLNKLLNGFEILNKIYDYLSYKNTEYFTSINESDRIMNLKLMSESKKFKARFENFNENLKIREENIKKIKDEKIKNLFFN